MEDKELVSRLVTIEGMFKTGHNLSFQELQMLMQTLQVYRWITLSN
jgi:uncharacterized coiled-coil DUF342 family protein